MNNNILITNLKSGFLISLIALPLCLGIAIASSFPPVAGLITAIVGGLVVSFIGGADISIKGPAAGLIAIVLASVTDLGDGDIMLGYKRTLAVGVIAALIQIIFALCKMARFGRLMPPSVIHGMLAAIGVIIVAKQVHILLGALPHGKTPFALLAEIPSSIMHLNPEPAFMGIFTLALIVLYPFIPVRFIKSIPPALVGLLVVIPLSLLWHLDNVHDYQFFGYNFKVGPDYLVNLPDNLLSSLVWPDFSVLTQAHAYKYVLMLALVGSIESVLTVIATDALQTTKKKSKLDRDLFGIGVGNLICSLIGGLPMISEVVRSKANIDNGATSRWSNFFHGAFLLLAISVLAPIIKEIPLAALAAMLIITGLRLAAPRQFTHAYRVGIDQFLLFITTLITTLATDLLMGVIAGVLLKIIIHVARGAKINTIFSMAISVHRRAEDAQLVIEGPMIFTNYFSLEKRIMALLRDLPKVSIDLSRASLIDHTTLSCLHALKDDLGPHKLEFFGLENLRRLSKHQLSTHRFIRA
jgi:MFS superfamily sulfate permease-like transporter